MCFCIFLKTIINNNNNSKSSSSNVIVYFYIMTGAFSYYKLGPNQRNKLFFQLGSLCVLGLLAGVRFIRVCVGVGAESSPTLWYLRSCFQFQRETVTITTGNH